MLGRKRLFHDVGEEDETEEEKEDKKEKHDDDDDDLDFASFERITTTIREKITMAARGRGRGHAGCTDDDVLQPPPSLKELAKSVIESDGEGATQKTAEERARRDARQFFISLKKCKGKTVERILFGYHGETIDWMQEFVGTALRCFARRYTAQDEPCTTRDDETQYLSEADYARNRAVTIAAVNAYKSNALNAGISDAILQQIREKEEDQLSSTSKMDWEEELERVTKMYMDAFAHLLALFDLPDSYQEEEKTEQALVRWVEQVKASRFYKREPSDFIALSAACFANKSAVKSILARILEYE